MPTPIRHALCIRCLHLQVDAIAETHDGKVTVRVTASYANAPHMAPRDLQLHWWVA